MDRAAIFERLRRHLATGFEIDLNQITEETGLVEDLDADSMDLLDLVLVLKDEFNVEIPDGEVKELLMELAGFLSPITTETEEMTEEQLAEFTRQLRVGNIVDFVIGRIELQRG